MWALIAYDLPVDSTENAKSYRRLLKKLFMEGFHRWQKSIFVHWYENSEQMEYVRRKLLNTIPKKGNFIMLSVPDEAMLSCICYKNGIPCDAPKAPLPWSIF